MDIENFPMAFPPFSSGSSISILTAHDEKYFSNQRLIKSLFVFWLYFDCTAYSRGWTKAWILRFHYSDIPHLIHW